MARIAAFRKLAPRLVLVLLILASAIALTGCSLGIFDQVIPPEPMRLGNESDQAFSMLGIYWDNHLLLHKAAAEDVRQAVFPGKLLEGIESVRLVGITSENRVYISETEAIKGKDQLVMKADQPLSGDSIPLLSRNPPWRTG